MTQISHTGYPTKAISVLYSLTAFALPLASSTILEITLALFSRLMAETIRFIHFTFLTKTLLQALEKRINPTRL